MRPSRREARPMVAMMTEMMGWPTMRLRKTRSTPKPKRAVRARANAAARRKGAPRETMAQ
jgi:hypothetical protein